MRLTEIKAVWSMITGFASGKAGIKQDLSPTLESILLAIALILDPEIFKREMEETEHLHRPWHWSRMLHIYYFIYQ